MDDEGDDDEGDSSSMGKKGLKRKRSRKVSKLRMLRQLSLRKDRRLKRKAYVENEMVETEKRYLDSLDLLIQHFYRPLKQTVDTPSIAVITRKEFNALFSNLVEIRALAAEFLAQLEQTREDEHRSMGDVFLAMMPFFKVYALYIKNYPNALAVFEHLQKTNDAFRRFVKEQSNMECMMGLPIESYLILPVQRLPRYRLLLETLLKNTPEHHANHQASKVALEQMSNMNQWVNERIRDHQEEMKLIEIQQRMIKLPPRLSSFTHQDAKEAHHDDSSSQTQDYSGLVAPGRSLIKMARVGKVCRDGCQYRLMVLVSDGLLLAKIKPPSLIYNETYEFSHWIPFSHIRVLNVPEPFSNEKFDDVPVADNLPYLNIPYSFIIVSRTRSFQLYCDSLSDKRELLGILSQNQKPNNLEKRHSLATLVPRMLSTDQEPESDQEDEDPAPIWVPDHAVSKCMVCEADFTMFLRRHHCRRCGSVICASCSSRTFMRNNEPQRACDPCYFDLYTPVAPTSPTPKPRCATKEPMEVIEHFGEHHEHDVEMRQRSASGVSVWEGMRRRTGSQMSIASVVITPAEFTVPEFSKSSTLKSVSSRTSVSSVRSNKSEDREWNWIDFGIPKSKRRSKKVKKQRSVKVLETVLSVDQEKRTQLSEIYETKKPEERSREFRFSLVTRRRPVPIVTENLEIDANAPTSDTNACELCHVPFTVFRRRTECQSCSRSVYTACSRKQKGTCDFCYVQRTRSRTASFK